MPAIAKFTQTFVDTAPNGLYHNSHGLYLDVRSPTQKSWSFRRAGKRISPPGGSARHVTVEQAEAFARKCSDKLASGEDPFSAKSRIQERQLVNKNDDTFGARLDQFIKKKELHDWSPNGGARLGRTMQRIISKAGFDKVPLQQITVDEIEAILKPDWMKKPEMMHRTRHLLTEFFGKWCKSHGYYVGDNPADFSRHSILRERLGNQPARGSHKDLDVTHIPQLFAYLTVPRYMRSEQHGDDFCTVAEAMDAWHILGREAILKLIRQGKLPGAYKESGYDWKQAPYLIPIAELEKQLGPPKQPLKFHTAVSPHAYALQYLILTAVRATMATELRWDQIKQNRPIPIIDYGVEHKQAQKDPNAPPYVVIITPWIEHLLATMRAAQKRDGLDKSEFVFVHGHARFGVNHWYGNTTRHTQLNAYMKRALRHLGILFDAKDQPTDHGFRAAFATWALELNDCYRENAVGATLGHKLKVPNRMYYRNVQFLNERRTMMLKWEKYCLSMVGQPQEENVSDFLREKGARLASKI
jgi:integrase